MLRPRPASSAPTRRPATSEDGFTIIELMVALMILVIGILGLFMGFISSQKASLSAERETSMAHIAEQQIEYLQGIPYSQIGMSAPPSTSTDSTNPDYYVTAGSPPSFRWNRTAASSETVDVDTTTPGVVTPVQSWNTGRFSGSIYDFVTWSTDSQCGSSCPSSQNYKRITVAVTIAGGSAHAVYLSSVIADPPAAAGDPLTSPGTTCTNAQGVAGQPCTSLIDSGNPNTYYLHDWLATNSGTPAAPSSDHATHPTVGTVSGQTCTSNQSQAGNSANTGGCPTPDLMDNNPPTGTGTLYHYSTDQASPGPSYPGGRLLQPTCSSGLCTGNSGAGTGATSDCSVGAWASTLLNVQSEFFVTAPLSSKLTLTGDGGISVYTQTFGGTSAVVSFCAEVYDVPPSGSAGSLADILAYPPVALGGAGYVPATDPNTGGNWPTSTSQVSYIFNFRGSNPAVLIPAGDRVGVRIWMKANTNTAIALAYDNTSYPSEIQLNSQ